MDPRLEKYLLTESYQLVIRPSNDVTNFFYAELIKISNDFPDYEGNGETPTEALENLLVQL